MTYTLDDGAVQEVLPFPTAETILPEDEPLTVDNANVFYRAAVLFPSFFGPAVYEAALNWFTMSDEDKLKVLQAAEDMTEELSDD